MVTNEPMTKANDEGWNQPDQLLSLLSRLASRAGLEMAIRLFTSSGVISGTLVGGASYFRDIVASIHPEGTPDDAPGSAIAGLFEHVVAQYEDVDRDEERAVAYIHLKDCWLYAPGQSPLEIGLWRGRLTSVEGWALGKYERTASEVSR